MSLPPYPPPGLPPLPSQGEPVHQVIFFGSPAGLPTQSRAALNDGSHSVTHDDVVLSYLFELCGLDYLVLPSCLGLSRAHLASLSC